MNRVLLALTVLSAFFVAAVPGVATAGSANPANCAFLDVNDDGHNVAADGDIVVNDAQWLNGTAFVASHPFVVPAGCLVDYPTVKAPLNGIRVTATKITFLGTLNYVPAGGGGVAFIADPANANIPLPVGLGDGSLAIGDGVTPLVRISAGGYTNLDTPAPNGALFPKYSPLAVLNVPAIPKKSVSLYAAGPCSINNAEVLGNRPFQDTMVGILCEGHVTIRSARIIASGVNIQSLTGMIDVVSGGGGGPNLASACDDPVINVVGGAAPPGNSNGILDAGDFDCQLDLTKVNPPTHLTPLFHNKAELEQYCKEPGIGRNLIQAQNDPLIMIAEQVLDVHGGVAPNHTDLAGRYRVVLASKTAGINTSLAHVYNYDQPTPPPGGAYIWLFAHPTSINRLTTEREDFGGPSGLGGATTDITGACYESPNPVQVGRRNDGTMPVVGVPALPAPPLDCLQFPADFVPILSKLF